MPSRVAHLLLEGPDAAGKTSLATQLCAAGYEYRHEGPPPAGVRPLQHYLRLLASVSHPTLFDRFHLGELVYGPIVRGQSGLSPYALRMLRRVVRGFGIRVILCLPPFDRALAVWQARRDRGGEFLQAQDQFAASYVAFAGLKDEARHVFNYTDGPAPLADYLAPLPCCLPGVIGNPTAPYLFVGDQSHEPVDLPFVGEAGSSVFLNTSLAAAGFREDDVSVTNAYDGRGQMVDLSSRVWQGQIVVTLGRRAEIAARQSGLVPAASLPHPSFWRRFHARDTHTYVRWLDDLRRVAA